MSPTDQKSFDLDEIVLRAKNLKQGTVSPAELEFARKALQSREGSLVAAIWIVGFVEARRTRLSWSGICMGSATVATSKIR